MYHGFSLGTPARSVLLKWSTLQILKGKEQLAVKIVASPTRSIQPYKVDHNIERELRLVVSTSTIAMHLF